MSEPVAPRPGLVHLGLRHESPDELAAAIGPHVRAAVQRGHRVFAIVDDDVVTALHRHLGAAAGWIRFQPPSTLRPTSAPAFLRLLRSWCRPERRTLVVGQYSVVEADEADCALREDGVNLVLGDLPLTLVCAFTPADGPGREATARHSHAGWVTARSATRNPAFRPPADRSSAPSGLWGRLVLRTSFRGPADLARVRHQVIELVCELGLRGADADAAVLAVHEAAALACRDRNDSTCVVEIRVAGTSLFTEVLAPGPAGTERHMDAHTVLGSTVADSDDLRPLAWFSHRVSVHDHARTRTIRVVVDRARPPAYRVSAPLGTP